MKRLQSYFQEYRQLLEEGANLKVIDRFYADNIVQYENNTSAFDNKSAVRTYEENAIKKVKNLMISFKNVVIDEKQQMVWGEMTNEFEDREKGKHKIVEAFFQQWREGEIVVQKFYYKGK